MTIKLPESKFTQFVLILLTIVAILSVAFYLLAFGAGSHLALKSKAASYIVIVLIIELTALWAFRINLKRDKHSLADIGWNKPTTAFAIALALIGAAFYIFLAFHDSALHINDHIKELSLLKLFGASVGLIAAFVEEIIFRGYFMTALKNKGRPAWYQIIVSGFVFGIVHITFSPIGVLYAMGLGIFLASLYVLGKRSLTAPMLCHAIINVVLEPWLILSVFKLVGKF